LPDGVIDRIEDLNPTDENYRRRHKNFQHLSTDIGLPHFRNQIISVMTLQRISDTKEEFEEHFKKAFNLERQLRLDLDLADEPEQTPASST
jgi:hypothetical protein